MSQVDGVLGGVPAGDNPRFDAGAITIRDLVINALRMRPDRIILGEIRGPECFDLLAAMNTGHDGSLTTVGRTYARYFVKENLPRRKDAIGFAQFVNRCVTHWHFFKFTREARAGKLRPDEMTEGTYTITNNGAFGTVILVEDTVVDEKLILKFLNPNIANDEEMLQRYVHELRFSRKITHKNVIRIYDFLNLSGNYAISMEYFLAPVVNRRKLETNRFG